MRAILGGGLYLADARDDELVELRDTHRLANPAFAQWERQQRRHPEKAGAPPPRYLTALRRLPGGPWIGRPWLPRAAKLPPETLIDDRSTFPPAVGLRLAEGLEPRVYQSEALAALVDACQGIVVIPCGGGKTTAGILAIAKLPTRALILVHTRTLLYQWVDELGAKLIDAEVGVVGDGKDQREARVVVALVQTLARWIWWDLYEWGREFGLVILDEAHHAPAETVCDLLAALPARYRLGLTATPDRADGLTPLLWWSFGDELVSLTPGGLERAGYTMAPLITWVRSGWPMPIEPVEAGAGVVADVLRNRLIVLEVLARRERRQLVLVDRVEHVEALRALLFGAGLRVAALIGPTTRRVRRQVLDALGGEDRQLDVVVATSVADEGLDLPALDVVHLAVAGRNASRVQQRVGRVVRRHPGKDRPEVVDYVDLGPVGRSQALARHDVYQACGWEADVPPVDWPDRGSRYTEIDADDMWRDEQEDR